MRRAGVGRWWIESQDPLGDFASGLARVYRAMEQARRHEGWQIPEKWKRPDGEINSALDGPFVRWHPRRKIEMELAGNLTSNQLRAIADHMDKHGRVP